MREKIAFGFVCLFSVAPVLASYVSTGGGTGANLGSGVGIYKDNTGGTINLKSLTAGSGITLSSDGTTISITAAGAGLGNVTGPASATVGHIATYAATDGTVIQDYSPTASRFITTATDGSLASSISTTLPVANGGTNSTTALSNFRVMISTNGKIQETGALTASKALCSDTNGIPVICASGPSTTEMSYVTGLSSAAQTQITAKAPAASPTFTGTVTTPVTASRVLVTGASSELAASSVTSAQLLLLQPSEYDAGNSSTAQTITWSNGNAQKSTLTGSVTYTFASPVTGTAYVLKIATGAGSFTATWPATVHWAAGTAPTITATASKVDLINFYYDGSTYFGSYTQNYAP